MWGSSSLAFRTFLRASPLAGAATVAITNNYVPTIHSCEAANKNKEATFKVVRKQTTLKQAVDGSNTTSRTKEKPRRFNTKEELSKLRINETEMLRRWERDEEGWRSLPARAWPAYQPNAEEMEGILVQVEKRGCTTSSKTDLCKELLFNVSTARVFYNLDAKAGFEQYEKLAKGGHVDSMVACGIILVEGLGIPIDEQKGIEWLQKAVAKDSVQAYYELGTVLYTGIDGVVEEDPEMAFDYFCKAAEQDHTAGLYMVADCLVEGDGTEINVAQAVPLFYRAAERGHRYSRQRIRELLSKKDYQP